MSSNISAAIGKFNFPMPAWKTGLKLRNKKFSAPFGLDDPDHCRLGANYWHQHPIQNFDYQFNSHGFRDRDFNQYLKTNTDIRVNVCFGDSFTVNIAGPQEHSWPSLLGKRLSNPTLNFGMNGTTPEYLGAGVAKAKQLFHVDKIFILSNLFSNHETIQGPAIDVDRKCHVLKQHFWIPDAYWQFTPPWTIDSKELYYLYRHFPDAHSYWHDTALDITQVDFGLLCAVLPVREKYQELSGPSWMQYEDFCQCYLSGKNVLEFFSAAVDKRLIKNFLHNYFLHAIKCIICYNRDGFHMNQQLNQKVADCFYQQSCIIKLK